MPRGGYRPGGGRPKGATASAKEPNLIRAEIEARKQGVTPLEYMLAVMNDPDAEQSRRDRMAIAAAGILARTSEVKGKREEQADAADKAAEGKFAVPHGPKLVVDNRR